MIIDDSEVLEHTEEADSTIYPSPSDMQNLSDQSVAFDDSFDPWKNLHNGSSGTKSFMELFLDQEQNGKKEKCAKSSKEGSKEKLMRETSKRELDIINVYSTPATLVTPVKIVPQRPKSFDALFLRKGSNSLVSLCDPTYTRIYRNRLKRKSMTNFNESPLCKRHKKTSKPSVHHIILRSASSEKNFNDLKSCKVHSTPIASTPPESQIRFVTEEPVHEDTSRSPPQSTPPSKPTADESKLDNTEYWALSKIESNSQLSSGEEVIGINLSEQPEEDFQMISSTEDPDTACKELHLVELENDPAPLLPENENSQELQKLISDQVNETVIPAVAKAIAFTTISGAMANLRQQLDVPNEHEHESTEHRPSSSTTSVTMKPVPGGSSSMFKEAAHPWITCDFMPKNEENGQMEDVVYHTSTEEDQNVNFISPCENRLESRETMVSTVASQSTIYRETEPEPGKSSALIKGAVKEYADYKGNFQEISTETTTLNVTTCCTSVQEITEFQMTALFVKEDNFGKCVEENINVCITPSGLQLEKDQESTEQEESFEQKIEETRTKTISEDHEKIFGTDLAENKNETNFSTSRIEEIASCSSVQNENNIILKTPIASKEKKHPSTLKSIDSQNDFVSCGVTAVQEGNINMLEGQDIDNDPKVTATPENTRRGLSSKGEIDVGQENSESPKEENEMQNDDLVTINVSEEVATLEDRPHYASVQQETNLALSAPSMLHGKYIDKGLVLKQRPFTSETMPPFKDYRSSEDEQLEIQNEENSEDENFVNDFDETAIKPRDPTSKIMSMENTLFGSPTQNENNTVLGIPLVEPMETCSTDIFSTQIQTYEKRDSQEVISSQNDNDSVLKMETQVENLTDVCNTEATEYKVSVQGLYDPHEAITNVENEEECASNTSLSKEIWTNEGKTNLSIKDGSDHPLIRPDETSDTTNQQRKSQNHYFGENARESTQCRPADYNIDKTVDAASITSAEINDVISRGDLRCKRRNTIQIENKRHNLRCHRDSKS